MLANDPDYPNTVIFLTKEDGVLDLITLNIQSTAKMRSESSKTLVLRSFQPTGLEDFGLGHAIYRPKLGGCQNNGPFMGPLSNTAPSI